MTGFTRGESSTSAWPPHVTPGSPIIGALETALSATRPEARGALLGAVLTWTAGRLLDLGAARDRAPAPQADDLLTVQEAAGRLKVPANWIYRRSRRLPFTVRLGARGVRVSARKLEAWIIERGA